MPDITIVTVDDFEFQVTESREVRSTSELLARKLGYSNRQLLERLAERHDAYLRKFGEIVTVTISIKRGPTHVNVQMPTYNKFQSTYLIAKSEQPLANELTVKYIKAVDRLEKMLVSRGTLDFEAFTGAIARAFSEAMPRALAPILDRISTLEIRTNEILTRSGGIASQHESREVLDHVTRVAHLYVAAGFSRSVRSARGSVLSEVRRVLGWTGRFVYLPSELLGPAHALLNEREERAQRVVRQQAEDRDQAAIEEIMRTADDDMTH